MQKIVYFDLEENEDGLAELPLEFWQEKDYIDEVDLVTEVANKSFKIKYLYPWQRLVIANILDAYQSYKENEKQKEIDDSEIDVLSEIFDEDGIERGKQIVLLPTGAGKSLCFLVPSLLLPGPTLIIYPLLALMSDQVRRMKEGGLDPCLFRGNQTTEERSLQFEKLKNGSKLILTNPEVLQNKNLLKRLAACKIAHIAIDEAHCVSEWGDSFRPSYLTLGDIIKELKVPLVTAFTATASPSVLSRIAEVLFDGKAHILRGDSDRQNISYSVVYAYCKEKKMLEEVIKAQKPVIVFCSTRKRAENSARITRAYYRLTQQNPDDVKFYHAGLEKVEKDEVESWFYPHKTAVLFSTCAFGMGTDKQNIRTVIHLDAPPTAEAYVQEAGRGGRDKELSKAILIWNPEDDYKAKQFIDGDRRKVLYSFANANRDIDGKPHCRRQILLDALGGNKVACSGCDVCNKTYDFSYKDAEQVLKFIKLYSKAYTSTELEQLLQKRFNKKGCNEFEIRFWEFNDIKNILSILLKQQKIRVCKWPWKNKVAYYDHTFFSKASQPVFTSSKVSSKLSVYHGSRMSREIPVKSSNL